MPFFVYKLTLRDTDYFFIGATKNIRNRRAQHAARISYYIKQFRLIPGYARKANCGYAWMAKQFLRRKRMFYTLGGFHSIDCKMEILHTAATEAEATERETFFIQQNISKPFCFNKQKESYYSSINKSPHATNKTTKSATTA